MNAFMELEAYLKWRGELPGRRKALQLLTGSPEVSEVVRMLWELDFWRDRERKREKRAAEVCSYCKDTLLGGPRCSNCGGL